MIRFLNLNKSIVNIFLILIIIIFSGCTQVENQDSTNINIKEDINKIKKEYESKFVELEKKYDVKLGVCAIDLNSNIEINYNADDRYPYCSTSKALAAAAVLEQYKLEDLEEIIKYKQEDLVSYSPITKDYVDSGMSIEDVCSAAVRFSDNTAGNILFNLIGGPNGFKLSLEKIGDKFTKPYRIEPELNNYEPGGLKDTSSPRQLALDLKEYTTGDTLTEEKKQILIDWMSGNATGDKLIRLEAPKDWIVADKSGAGAYGSRNDLAIVMPKNKKPIIIAIMSIKEKKEAKFSNEAVSDAAKVIFECLD
ncbi:class A beta-lactamase [Peptostreptococcaceae bacterium AGR-M142]